ncbi:MAG TPA: hypothetical protein PKC03_05995 [Dokdonella sp.]|jgi:hypothetical protein|nr:hypothetical protein [Dokdonella sp.]
MKNIFTFKPIFVRSNVQNTESGNSGHPLAGSRGTGFFPQPVRANWSGFAIARVRTGSIPAGGRFEVVGCKVASPANRMWKAIGSPAAAQKKRAGIPARSGLPSCNTQVVRAQLSSFSISSA